MSTDRDGVYDQPETRITKGEQSAGNGAIARLFAEAERIVRDEARRAVPNPSGGLRGRGERTRRPDCSAEVKQSA